MDWTRNGTTTDLLVRGSRTGADAGRRRRRARPRRRPARGHHRRHAVAPDRRTWQIALRRDSGRPAPGYVESAIGRSTQTLRVTAQAYAYGDHDVNVLDLTERTPSGDRSRVQAGARASRSARSIPRSRSRIACRAGARRTRCRFRRSTPGSARSCARSARVQPGLARTQPRTRLRLFATRRATAGMIPPDGGRHARLGSA